MEKIRIKDLMAYLKKMPQDLPVVTSSDDEGNSFQYVYFTPTKGKFLELGMEHGDFVDSLTIQKDKGIKEEFKKGIDVVCIN